MRACLIILLSHVMTHAALQLASMLAPQSNEVIAVAPGHGTASQRGAVLHVKPCTLQAKQAEQAELQPPVGQPATAIKDVEAVPESAADLETAGGSLPEQSTADAEAAATTNLAADVSHASSPAPQQGSHAEAACKPVSSDGPSVSSSPSSDRPDDAPGVRSAPEHAFDDGAECVVCWEARACLMMQPCGHICVCSGCAAMLRDTLCPMCRTEVASRLLVKP